MKKTLLYSLAAFVGLSFMSCSGDYDDWMAPQHNDQDSAITIPGFTASAAGDVNLANPGTDVKVFSLSTATLPEGAQLGHTRVVLTPTDEAAAYTLPQELDATNEGTIDSTALQTAVVKAYGKRPSARPFKAHVYSDVVANGQALFVDAGEISVNVSPKAPFISKAYYIVGDFNSWSLNETSLPNYKFSRSDKDVYEDPIFTFTLTTTGTNQCWKIIPQENIDANNLWAHVDAALAFGVDILWIGARTTANPFAMQEIADALKGHNVPVLIKNPVNPDIELWIGGIERIYRAGITRIGVIHRGFSSADKKIYRNLPQWHLPIELRRRYPNLPILCDPSHIGGRRDLVQPLSQQAMDLGFDGLIIESHCNPDCAWSDAKQQVTPDTLEQILSELVIRDHAATTESLTDLRHQIDEIDEQILEILAKRICRDERDDGFSQPRL